MNRDRHSDMEAFDMDLERSRTGKLSKGGQLSRSLSRSTPSIPASTQKLSARSSSTRSLSTSTNSARQNKFHRHFSQAPTEESVLYCYKCALVRDILLQGHLYVTPNYFAFYSNIFGYVTKLLIPMTSVIKISKEKMAKILPNEIAITTKDSRHVFCSLFWKNSTFKLLNEVWSDSKESPPEADIPLCIDGKLFTPENRLADISEKNSEENLGNFQTETDRASTPSVTCTVTAGHKNADEPADTIPRPVAAMISIRRFFRPSTRLVILVALLAALYVSAALMMVRINRLHAAYLDHRLILPQHIARNHHLQYLQLKLDRIVQVRHNLQMLSQNFAAISEGTDVGPISGGVFGLDD